MAYRYAVILAAGQGTRMKSRLYKVLHPVCGKPMIKHIIDQVSSLDFNQIITVISRGAETVREAIDGKTEVVVQDEQLGTAHAALQAEPYLANHEGTTVVLYGDTPLITAKTIENLIDLHEREGVAATVLTAIADNPTGYGRVLRDHTGHVAKIVEEKDTTDEEKPIKEINTGIYCFDNRKLFEALTKVDNNNAQNEYYLPDVLTILQEEGDVVAAYQADVFEETMGVNDRKALAEAERLMRKRINDDWMLAGVTIIDPNQTYISPEAKIERDTIIYPGTTISGTTVIGEGCEIGPNSDISNAQIGAYTIIKHSVVTESIIEDYVQIGPFAHIRPQSEIKDHVKIGNFVEIKKAQIGAGSKASHLSYVGDAEIGKDVNLGCGSITVNYDGKNKFVTKIEDGAFIGCNSNLVAPVTIGKEAYVAAGSTITDHVPGDALAIARSRQTTKEHYARKLNHKKK
ncbi:bifunctional UDP-N-acetylglucosamine diphosphorylase/glucosamine-1-phosphate N-acetyltransferase GlmU [Camelliibacillus cellulosilyticus]|uniref:Bifunctional protein GlmU n=1 Tax=Camelliibacillus cellulosilyticus TaxID=2174486 RepID=A0ABV9GQ15_9BACL